MATIRRMLTFTKRAHSLSAQFVSPLPSANQPRRATISLRLSIPSGASFKVELCNNPFDTAPVWEDATAMALKGYAYVFRNTARKSSENGLNLRITASRGGAQGECWIADVRGNFE